LEAISIEKEKENTLSSLQGVNSMLNELFVNAKKSGTAV
jgi:hypothetical protein